VNSIVPKRPILRYHGGKWRLAPWIIGFFPPHRVYVEPFAGAASVLMLKPRVAAECLNDLDDGIVSVFRLLRDSAKATELRRRLELTPYARSELNDAYLPPFDEIDAVRKTIVKAFMGHGSDTITRGYRTGFRCKNSEARSLPAADWRTWPQEIPAFVDRLQGVAIESRSAVEVIERLDSPGTLFYVDPPYVYSTRTAARGRHGYKYEMTDQDHADLATCLHDVDGMVVLSGYPCELYDRSLYPDWLRHERSHMADGARPRTEVVWLNPACARAIGVSRSQLRLIA